MPSAASSSLRPNCRSASSQRRWAGPSSSGYCCAAAMRLPGDAMIEAFDVSVEIGGRPVLEHVGFTARPGQLTAVIGPNGSGKTTLMKALCRDYDYDGLVSINGRDLQ